MRKLINSPVFGIFLSGIAVASSSIGIIAKISKGNPIDDTSLSIFFSCVTIFLANVVIAQHVKKSKN